MFGSQNFNLKSTLLIIVLKLIVDVQSSTILSVSLKMQLETT